LQLLKSRNGGLTKVTPVGCDSIYNPAVCGPVGAFVRISLGFRCSISSLHTDNLSLFW